MTEHLTSDQLTAYERDGFLVLAGFASAEACAALRTRADELLAAFDPDEHRSVFTTNEQTRHVDDEFLTSGDTVRCFFEEEAFDADGHLTVPKERAVNKIGHAQHDLDPVCERFTYTPELAAVAADIGLPDALALQSMLIFKQPHIGGEVGCHQDATFLYTDPVTVTGFWFALEDATLENGCLWAAPGGHRGPLRKLFKRTQDDHHTTFEVLDPTPLPEPPGDLVPLEVEAGTMVVLNGRLPHWSDVNRSHRSRYAYTVHCIAESADYPSWNWLRRGPDLPLRRLDRVAEALTR